MAGWKRVSGGWLIGDEICVAIAELCLIGGCNGVSADDRAGRQSCSNRRSRDANGLAHARGHSLVVDVIVAADGHPSAAVIDFGGFLGVGSRKIAVDWRLLRFAPGRPDWQVLLTLGRAEIQAAPEYKPDAATREMVGPPWEAPPSTAVHE